MCGGSGNSASARPRESREAGEFLSNATSGGWAMRTVPVEDDALARCGGDVARDVEGGLVRNRHEVILAVEFQRAARNASGPLCAADDHPVVAATRGIAGDRSRAVIECPIAHQPACQVLE